jgi:hypothetical protein
MKEFGRRRQGDDDRGLIIGSYKSSWSRATRDLIVHRQSGGVSYLMLWSRSWSSMGGEACQRHENSSVVALSTPHHFWIQPSSRKAQRKDDGTNTLQGWEWDWLLWRCFGSWWGSAACKSWIFPHSWIIKMTVVCRLSLIEYHLIYPPTCYSPTIFTIASFPI